MPHSQKPKHDARKDKYDIKNTYLFQAVRLTSISLKYGVMLVYNKV